jgi:tRNA threonylcarbamoyladenosine biosynthesis protein TsaB
LNILILDTTTYSPAFAYYSNGECKLCRVTENERNADSILLQIKDGFSELGIAMKDIEAVSLSNGPGSYTGLRVGSAIAKGICFAGKAGLLLINTLDIIAESLADRGFELLTAVIPTNSKSSEFYYAEYKNKDGRMKRNSDYKVDISENINESGRIIVIDKAEKVNLTEGADVHYTDGNLKVKAQYRLTMEMIRDGKFAEISGSEPFYMKDFVPLKSKKNNLI